MALNELDLFEGERNKVTIAIARLREFEPPEGYYLAFSGGKDSVCILALAELAGVKYDAHYAVTGIDPPDLVYFIRREYPDVKFERRCPAMLTELVSRGFPMRQARWCCEFLKEGKGVGRKVVTGVRWAESSQRKNRKLTEVCLRNKHIWYVHPILDWTDADVWEFIHTNNLPYCSLYDQGWKRLGCMFCPMSREKEKRYYLARYPGYERAFRRAFNRLYAMKKSKPRPDGTTSVDRWADGNEMFEWWLFGELGDPDNGTGSLFD